LGKIILVGEILGFLSIFNNYSHLDWWSRFHIRARLKACPWQLILKYFPDGEKLVDIGCGHGIFIHLLAESDRHFEQFIGVDLASDKIEIAKTTADSRMTFCNKDIYKIDLTADVFSLLDVLYLIPYKEQLPLLKYLYEKLPTNGYLVVKEVAKEQSIKYYWSYFEEIVMIYLLRKTLGSRIYFRTRDDYVSTLKSIGFNVTVHKIDKGYFYPHILYVCDKSNIN